MGSNQRSFGVENTDKIKEDIINKYIFTQQQAKNIGPRITQFEGPIFTKKPAQPIYSLSIKMTAETKLKLNRLISLLSPIGKRFGPGKLLKYLINYYEKEEIRKKNYSKQLIGYLSQIRAEVEASGYDPVRKSFSPLLSSAIKNIDSYCLILGYTKKEARDLLKEPSFIALFDLYYALSGHSGLKNDRN